MLIIHGQIKYLIDCGPEMDLRLACFSQTSSYIIFCPNVAKVNAIKKLSLQLFLETLDKVQDRGDQLLLLARGPEVLKFGQVEECLLIGPGAFLRNLMWYPAYCFQPKVPKEKTQKMKFV